MSPSSDDARLLPLELEWSARLRGALGHPLRIQAELDSAMDLAHAFAEAGEPEGSCVVAEHQRRGRGRHDRRWEAPPGSSLLLALILRPSWPPERAGLFALVAALALARAAEEEGADLALKWPNDLLHLHDGRKVAGVLTEARLSGSGYRHLILGVGVNVHQPPGDFPPELRETAVSLDQIVGRRLSRGDLLAGFLLQMEAVLAALAASDPAPRAALLESWRERWPHAGRRARDEAGRALTLVDLEPDGALRVLGPEGEEVLRAGEVQLLLED